MESTFDHPWFREAVQRLEPRRDERILLVTAPLVDYAAGLAQLAGDDGLVRVVEPHRATAEAIAEAGLDNVEVLALQPGSSDRFGSHDAMLGCPWTMPRWPLGDWAEIAVHNLRPGGRFVIDLPAESVAEPLAGAWRDIGGTPDQLEPLIGVSERELAASLRKRGLRQVEAAMATHLVQLESPSALAQEICAAVDAAERAEDLALALTQRLRASTDADWVVRRTRVHGIR